MCPAIANPSDALEWLATQPTPLTPPPNDEGAWSRRLIEACAWLTLAPLMNLAQNMQDMGGASPDLTDTTAGVQLSSSVRDPAQPLVVDPALMIQNKERSAFVSLSAPAPKLGLPSAVAQAMSDGTLKQALSAYADGVFFLPAHGSLLESLMEARGATHPWVVEHSYDRLAQALPGPTPASPAGRHRL